MDITLKVVDGWHGDSCDKCPATWRCHELRGNEGICPLAYAKVVNTPDILTVLKMALPYLTSEETEAIGFCCPPSVVAGHIKKLISEHE